MPISTRIISHEVDLSRVALYNLILKLKRPPMTSSVPMTKKGEQALKDELKQLIETERPAISKAISEAREHGDLKENAEYHAAKDKQGLIEARIAFIQSRLKHSQVIDVSRLKNTGTVTFGATVTLLNCDNEK